MKLLGTHNSLSYLPCQWWLRPFAWIGRCQSLHLAEQYQEGVRLFDIRIKYVNGKAVSGHGLMTCNVNIDTVLTFLNTRTDKCIVRLFLENSKRNPEKHFERFANDIEKWKESYGNIRFVEGGCRYQYRQLISDNVSIRHCYWQKGYTLIPYPKGYAEEHNHIFHRSDNDINYSMYDFIEY